MQKQLIKRDGRRYPLRMPPDWEPPFPAYDSVFPERCGGVSMSVLGCRFRPGGAARAKERFRELTAALGEASADHIDYARCEDGEDPRTVVAIAYWLEPDAAARWYASDTFRRFWAEQGRSQDDACGVFREVFNVSLERLETLFSEPDHLAGFSHARAAGAPADLHGYWGAMRDRIPLSADDPLAPKGDMAILEQDASRILLCPNSNLCVIRSGQDWSRTAGPERTEYLEEIEPVLRSAMRFLRDQGDQVHCRCCRYMREMDADWNPAERTFGLAYFRSMADLEAWAEHHPTHLEIFNRFLQMAPKYGPDLRLRLWHEVSVLPAQGQFMEYLHCRPGPGMLP